MAIYYNGVKMKLVNATYSTSGLPIEVSTAEDLTSRILITNVNKIYLFTGETDETYTHNHYYSLKEISANNYEFLDIGNNDTNLCVNGDTVSEEILSDETINLVIGGNE